MGDVEGFTDQGLCPESDSVVHHLDGVAVAQSAHGYDLLAERRKDGTDTLDVRIIAADDQPQPALPGVDRLLEHRRVDHPHAMISRGCADLPGEPRISG